MPLHVTSSCDAGTTDPCSLATTLANVWADDAAGRPVAIHLGTGLHILDAATPFTFDHLTKASEVRLLGIPGTQLQADGSGAVLSVSSGAPHVSMQGLVLLSPVAVEGGELLVDNCTFAGDRGGTMIVRGGTVTAQDSSFNGAAIDLAAGGSLVYRLPAPLGHWINSLGQDDLALTAGESYIDFPPTCSAGLFGNKSITKEQSSPFCSGLCPAGHTCGLATVVPLPCERGGYCPEGSPAARPCTSGRYGGATGMSSAAECLVCPPGAACGVGAAEPTPCSPGTFAPNGSSAACLMCPKATYQPDAGATECVACGVGYYCPPGSSSRIPASCNEGSFLPAGRAFADQNDCEPCAIGSWCVGGRSAPKQCSVGSFANTTGLGECVSCSPGKFQNEQGATGCKLCPVASYCNGEGSSAATPCPGGTWSSSVGLEAQAQCTKVVKGQWASTGSTVPKECPASGFYCPGYDADAVNTPPGSEPILIDSGAARDSRNVSVVTFALTLESDLSSYDPNATRTTLASLYDVPAASISLTVQAGSLQLLVSIRPPNSTDAGVAALAETIRSTPPEELSAQLEVNATVAAVLTTTVLEEYEATCPKGFWCSAGNTIPCPLNTYNNETDRIDQGSCTPCPANAFTTAEGSTSAEACICEAEHYARWDDGVLRCVDCPVGANCSAAGSTFEHLPLEEGHWRRVSNSTDVRRCRGGIVGSACVGCFGAACEHANYTGCKAGTGGPYCGLCVVAPAEDGGVSVYYDRDEMACLPCNEDSALPLIVLGGALLFLCLLSIGLYVAKRRAVKKRAQGAVEQRRHTSRMRRLVTRERTWWTTHASNIKRRVKIKIKILFTFYQIATKVGQTYLVVFPKSVEQSLEVLSFVNLELDGLGLPLACVKLGSFEQKLLFMMLTPVVILLFTKIIGWFRRDRQLELDLVEQSSSAAGKGSRNSSLGRMSAALQASTHAFLPMALRVTFLAFPTVSSLAFKAFRCDDLDADDDGRQVGVMSEDFSVECWAADGGFTPEYQRIRYLAGLAIFLYPMCVPCAYIVLFWKARKAIWSGTPSKLSSSMNFLIEEYDPAFFFWELVEVIKKFLLVGAMSMVLPGTLNQLILAFVIVLFFQTALLVARPYKRPEDDMIALGSGFGLVMFFFFTLILKVQTLTEAVGDKLTGQLAKAFAIDHKTNTVLLLASTFGALVLGGVMIVIETAAAAAAAAVEKRKQAALLKELEALREEKRASAVELEAMKLVLSEEKIPDVMKRCLIDTSEITFGRKLGQGAFGEVWLAQLNGTPVAVKKLHRNRLDEANLKMFRAECELQLSLRHPNLVQLLGGSWTLEDVNVCVVLELCEKGTLQVMATPPSSPFPGSPTPSPSHRLIMPPSFPL